MTAPMQTKAVNSGQPRALGLLIGLLIVLGTATIGGCAASNDRENYFESRQAMVQPHAGTGEARLVLWPGSTWGRSTLAVADRRSDSTPILPREAESSATR